MNVIKYNILFLYAGVINPLRGGIESVTHELSNYFTSKGHKCYYLSKKRVNDIGDNKQYFLPNESKFLNEENKAYLIKFIKEKKIDILINQGGFDKDCCQFAYIAKDYGVKLISCIHHPLVDKVKNFEVVFYNRFKKYRLQTLLGITKNSFVKNILYSIYWLKYQKHFKNLHKHSDSVVLLSDSFREDLSFFIGTLSNKIQIIPNPIPSKIHKSEADIQKEKIVLYVGRICVDKRVDLLLQIWSLVYKKHKDWKLVIVGGEGEELDSMKEYASTLQLENVFFEGFQEPRPYYEKASIFCMTSAIETFGIVLIEAMNMKVVPIAFESFSTVRDIIDNNINGILVPPFDTKLYAEKLSELMTNDNARYNFSNNAHLKSQQFQIDAIGSRWLSLFSSLFK